MGENNAYFEINGWKVWFEKFGSGPNTILLIPGPIGTGRTDFEELLDGEDELDFDKFTVIAVEAPGWGRSRPPARQFGANVYNNDCECFSQIMKNLGFDKYSIIGLSEGSKTALLMALKYPESVISLVLSSFKVFSSNKGLNALLETKDVKKWKKDKIRGLLKVYETEDEIQKTWNRYLKFAEFYAQYFPQDMFKDKYQLVRCPVLLTHGDKDQMVESEQPLAVSKRLSNARLHRFPNGDHESHQKYSAQYLKIVQDHILKLPNYNENKEEENENLIGWE